MNAKKLCKSKKEKVIAGVCGGVAEYFNTDPTVIRLLWVVLTLMGCSGLVLYIVAAIIMPVSTEG